jgi:hypothetical protein
MKSEKTQISKIRNEKGEKMKITKEIEVVVRDYFENLYCNKLENLEEMDKVLDVYEHTNLNLVDIQHLSRSITHNEIGVANKNLPKKKSPGSDRFSAEFYQMSRELIPTHKLLHDMEREGALLNSFYEASITLIPKLDKDTFKKEN